MVDQETAKALLDLYDFVLENKIGECAAWDEWCEAELFHFTRDICECSVKQQRPIMDCIQTKKYMLERRIKK